MKTKYKIAIVVALLAIAGTIHTAIQSESSEPDYLSTIGQSRLVINGDSINVCETRFDCYAPLPAPYKLVKTFNSQKYGQLYGIIWPSADYAIFSPLQWESSDSCKVKNDFLEIGAYRQLEGMRYEGRFDPYNKPQFRIR